MFKLPMTLLLFHPINVYLDLPTHFFYFVALYSVFHLGFSLWDHSLTTVTSSFRISFGKVCWWSFLFVCFCLNTFLFHPNFSFFFLFTIEYFKHIQNRNNSIRYPCVPTSDQSVHLWTILLYIHHHPWAWIFFEANPQHHIILSF